jgi:predicted enzyme related to lactoylglutathione lyase
MSADTLCWTDIPVTNLDRAIKFYSAILGKEVRKLSGGGMEYGLLPHEEQNASGCLCIRGDSGGVDNRPSANGPLIYLSVEGRLDKAVEAARGIAEKCYGRGNKSASTDFALWLLIPKATALPCIQRWHKRRTEIDIQPAAC